MQDGPFTLAREITCTVSVLFPPLPRTELNKIAVFPGLGLGAILSRASAVTDSMVEAASLGLADALTPDERQYDLLYPRIERIREISADIALKVIRAAQKAVSCFTRLFLQAWDVDILSGRGPFSRPSGLG